MNDLKHEMRNERLTGKLRWVWVARHVDEMDEKVLQQEYEVTVHRYNDDSSHTQETKTSEWRDVPCE